MKYFDFEVPNSSSTKISRLATPTILTKKSGRCHRRSRLPVLGFVNLANVDMLWRGPPCRCASSQEGPRAASHLHVPPAVSVLQRRFLMRVERTLRSFRRHLYGLRSIVPGLRYTHRIESLVGPLGYWNQLQRYQLRVVTELGLKPHHTLLDIGCGPLQGGIVFTRYLEPAHYVGVDHKPSAIKAAHDELSRRRLWGKNPRVLFSHCFGDDHLGDAQFDFIWLSQVLYYFDESAADRLFAMARRRLRPGGMMAGDILGPATDSSFLRDPKPPAHTPESLDKMARPHGLRTTRLGTLSEFGYPRRLNLRHNVLIKVTRQPA